MKTNSLPHYDDSTNTTGCCPKFNPDGWDDQELHFKDKRFARATTLNAMAMRFSQISTLRAGRLRYVRRSCGSNALPHSGHVPAFSADSGYEHRRQ